jgi:hypothetical protein
MPCNPEELRHVPLLGLLDDDEAQVLAAQVEIEGFAPLRRTVQDRRVRATHYAAMPSEARVTTSDEDQQEVPIDEPAHGEFFGFASKAGQT